MIALPKCSYTATLRPDYVFYCSSLFTFSSQYISSNMSKNSELTEDDELPTFQKVGKKPI